MGINAVFLNCIARTAFDQLSLITCLCAAQLYQKLVTKSNAGAPSILGLKTANYLRAPLVEVI